MASRSWSARASLVLLGPRMEPCYYLVVDGRPGVAFMVIDGRIARLDVRQQATVKTAEGAGVGAIFLRRFPRPA